MQQVFHFNIFKRMEKEKNIKIVAKNRKAYHDYKILETYEAGLELKGSEVKSLRDGKVTLRDSFARVANEQIKILNMHISSYDKATQFGHDPKREKKLLMHKREIKRLMGKTFEKGFTLIPLKVYFKGGFAKVELALVTGKRKYDKRKSIAEKEAKRKIERAFKERQK